MKKAAVTLFLAFAIAQAAFASTTSPQAVPEPLEVHSIRLGHDLLTVFMLLGIPQAVQVVDGHDRKSEGIQLLYFRGEDILSIDISDLPDNKVTEIELSGNSWKTNSPIKVGDSVDKSIETIGRPDTIEDLSAQKKWMLDQVGDDELLRKLIEKNSGDSALVYQKLGLYAEYDQNERVVKTIRIFEGGALTERIAGRM